MATRDQHVFELVAADLEQWMTGIVDELADGLMYKGRSPFSAAITESAKLDYYRATLTNPDGTPNAEGRTALLKRVGVQGYVQVIAAIDKGQGADLPEMRTATEGEGY